MRDEHSLSDESDAPRLEAELAELARAHRHLTDRHAHAEALVADLRADLAAAQTRGSLALGEVARLSRYLEALESTRTFRFTRRLRAAYGALLSLVRRRREHPRSL